MKRWTEAEIEAHRTEKGGFSKASLAAMGVPWPAPAGWKEALKAGIPVGVNTAGNEVRFTLTDERMQKLRDAADCSAIDLHQYALIMLGKMIDRGEFLQPEDWWRGSPEDLETFKRTFSAVSKVLRDPTQSKRAKLARGKSLT